MKKLAALLISAAALLSACGSDVVDNGVQNELEDVGDEIQEEVDQVSE